jgi:hypothetical protein
MAIVYDRENELEEIDEMDEWGDDSDFGYPPVVPGLDNSTLPRDLLEASQRPKGPYTFYNLEQMEFITSTIATSPTLQDWIANMPPASKDEG